MLETIILGLSDKVNKIEIEYFCHQTKEIKIIIVDNKIKIEGLLKQYKDKNKIKNCLLVTDQEDLFELASVYKLAVLVYVRKDNKENNFAGASYGIMTLEGIEKEYLIRVWQRYQGLPWKIAETKRCLIREMTVGDVNFLYEIYRDPGIVKYVEKLYADKQEEIAYTEAYIKNMYEFYGFGMWIIEDKETQILIGRAGLNYREESKIPELGYLIRKEYQNQGYAYEACNAILHYAKEELEFKKIYALVDEDNLHSIHLCEKLGFHYSEPAEVNGKKLNRFIIDYS